MPRKPKPKKTILIEEAYARCFMSPEGQIVLEDLKRQYHDGLSIPPVLDDTAVNAMLVNEGSRRVYLRIANIVEAARNGGQPDRTNYATTNIFNGSIVTDGDELN